MMSLQNKTLSGLFWSLMQRMGSKGILFLSTIALARILTPSEFGLIGMLTIFIQVSMTLVNGGLSQALVQKKDVDSQDYSSVFYINLFISIILYPILFFLAPFIARFYHQEILIGLVRVLSLVFVINVFSFVQEARLIREMQFKKLMVIHIPSAIIGGIVSIVMAFAGYGVWSIVALQLVTRLFYAIQLWIFAKWKPLRFFSLQRASKLFSFGGKVMLSAIINTIYDNIYLVIIGRFFPLASVGYYQNANNLVQYPSTTFSGAMDTVFFSALSSIQDEEERLRNGYKMIIQQLFFWVCPVYILAAVLATPLFELIFTDKWLPAVPYFQLLCVVGLLYPLTIANKNILNVKGRSGLVLRLTVVEKLVITIGLFISVSWGIWALLICQVFNSIFAYLLNTCFTVHFIRYPFRELVKDLLPTLLLSMSIGGVILLLNSTLHNLGNFLQLLLGLSLGFGLYWIASKKLRLKPYLKVVQLVSARLIPSS